MSQYGTYPNPQTCRELHRDKCPILKALESAQRNVGNYAK